MFGGAISTPGYDYVDFLMPGIIIQSIAFGGFVTAIGLTEDLRKGLIDRFRSLPMTRSAVLAGRTLADIVLNTFSLVVMLSVGFIVGFNFDSPAYEIVAGILLLLLFGYAFSWFFALIGMIVELARDRRSRSASWRSSRSRSRRRRSCRRTRCRRGCRSSRDVNPFTIVVDAVRALWLDAPAEQLRLGRVRMDARDDRRVRPARRPRVPPRRAPRLAHRCSTSFVRPSHAPQPSEGNESENRR